MSKHDARRPLKFDLLQTSVEEIQELREHGYTMAGNWNLSQICQHLSKTLKISIEGAPFRLPFLLRPFARWLLFDSVMRGRPTRLPLIAPSQFQPDEPENVDQHIANYQELVGKVTAADAQLISDHPVFGRVSLEEWRKFHCWHAAHHLSFLQPTTDPTQAEQTVAAGSQ